MRLILMAGLLLWGEINDLTHLNRSHKFLADVLRTVKKVKIWSINVKTLQIMQSWLDFKAPWERSIQLPEAVFPMKK